MDARQHLFQNPTEVGKFLRPVFFSGPIQLFDERLHAVEAGFVEQFKNVERGEEKSAGAAGRVKDADVY